jgi:hypothetical protein
MPSSSIALKDTGFSVCVEIAFASGETEGAAAFRLLNAEFTIEEASAADFSRSVPRRPDISRRLFSLRFDTPYTSNERSRPWTSSSI